MDKKITCIVAYAGVLGGALGLLPGIGKLGMFLPLIIWCVAYFAGDKSGAKLHLNQTLILIIAGLIGSLIGFIPLIGFVVNLIIWIATVVFGILGLVAAIKEEDKKLPIIGDIALLK